MVNLSKACMALHCMPKRFESFSTDVWDYMEMRSLYDFVFNATELKYSQSQFKQFVCNELGVSREVFDDVANDLPLFEVLSLEAEGTNDWTTDEVVGVVERWNAAGPTGIIEFAQGLSSDQAPIVWRWMLKHNWPMYKRRLQNFLYLRTGSNRNTPADVALGRLYEDKELPSFVPLMAWKEGKPDKMWRINDAKSLYYYDTVYVRDRSGEVNDRLTAFVVSNPFNRKERAWLWSDGTTTRSTLDDGEDVSFGEAVTWLDLSQYDRPALLIERDGLYYLYTRGTRTLRVAITGADTFTVDKHMHYRFDLSVMDGGSLTSHPSLTVSVSQLTPILAQRLKQTGVILQRRTGYQKVDNPIVCDVVYTWSPDTDWSFTFSGIVDAGLSDVDEYVDFAMMTEVDE